MFKPMELPDHVRERLRVMQERDERMESVVRELSNEDLVATVKFWMAHCDAPKRAQPGQPVYDSTMWHIMLPELLRRLNF